MQIGNCVCLFDSTGKPTWFRVSVFVAIALTIVCVNLLPPGRMVWYKSPPWTVSSPNHDGYQKPLPDHSASDQFDLSKLGPFPRLPRYRSLCWMQKEGLQPDPQKDGLPQKDSLRCLPDFYLAGFPKCGTTDLYSRLVKHPQVQSTRKEPHWVTRGRFTCASKTGESATCLQRYAAIYGRALQRPGAQRMIVGDYSASTMWDNHLWFKLPGNENCAEPSIINADYIRHLIPHVKIIIMLRYPTSRLYSDYMYFNKNVSQKEFHDRCKEMIASFNDCLKSNPLRTCAYNPPNKSKVRLHVGLYSIYLNDWLARFPRDRFLVLRLEDFNGDMRHQMTEVFKFLKISQPSPETMKTILEKRPANVGKRKQNSGNMYPRTKKLLDDFYQPFNLQLAALMNDSKFLWSNP